MISSSLGGDGKIVRSNFEQSGDEGLLIALAFDLVNKMLS
jgi:hypothetical protein